MNWKHDLLLGLLAFGVLLVFAAFQFTPGYMDAEYYYSMGLRIVKDGVTTEPFIWNYLSQPDQIPHPGFSFWMPMPSFITAGSMTLTGLENFWGARILFLFFASIIAPLTARIAFVLTGQIRLALISGLLAVFPFLYTPFFTTTDSFGIYMLLGGLYTLVLFRIDRKRSYFLLGLIVGFMHLTRADGLIWLLGGMAAILIIKTKRLSNFINLFSGYLLVMGFWYVRNWITFGELMPSGAANMFWLTEYNDLFNLYPEQLNFSSWKNQGIPTITSAILQASLTNLKTIFFVVCQILLFPLVLLGIKLKWKLTLVKTIAIIGFLTFVLMSVVFPFAGSRGGMFHSSAGIQPFVWAVSAAGLQVFIAWGERKRGWEQKRAEVMFGALLVTVAVGLTVFSLLNRVIGNQWNQSVWNESDHYHHLIAQELNELEAESTDLVMLNNPPGYYATTGRSAVVIPNGGITETLLAAERYDVLFLVLDKNHPPQLNDVYQQPEEYQQLTYLGTTAEIHFFRFNAGIIDD